uniref:DUF3459 domain-containing protein n=1 Tax=Macrostomum lignano TaxID=282301 RepID=A0A1I8FSQ8_9PLAT
WLLTPVLHPLRTAGFRWRQTSSPTQASENSGQWRRSVNGHAFRGELGAAGRWPECAGAGGYWRPGASGDRHLFAKYMIRQPARGLLHRCVLTSDGWELTLSPLDCPLRVRLSLGPESRSGKLLVREAGRPAPRGSILQLASLPTPMLHHLLDSLDPGGERRRSPATKAC